MTAAVTEPARGLPAFTFDRGRLADHLDDAGYVSSSLRACWAALGALSQGFTDFHWWTLRSGASESEILASVRCTGVLTTAASAVTPWSLVSADDGGGPLDGEWAVVLSVAGGRPAELLRVVDYTLQPAPAKGRRWTAPTACWWPVPRSSVEPTGAWGGLWSPGRWREVNTWGAVPTPEQLARTAYALTSTYVGDWTAFAALADVTERTATCPEVGTLVIDRRAARWTDDHAFGVVVGAGVVRTWTIRTNGWTTGLWSDHPELRALRPTVHGRAV